MIGKCLKNKTRNRFLSLILIIALVFQISLPVFANSQTPVAVENSAPSKSLLSQGLTEFKNSFDGVGTPSWFLTKFGIEMGYHLIDCVTNKEKPDVVKVVKSMATADYWARSAGGVLGYAAGSVFIPFLSSVPIFGGLLANFVPLFACYLGGDVSGAGLKGLKEGKFSFKNYFKTLDWTAMLAGSFGWAVGSMIGSAVFPPIGGIVGGMLGDLVAGKLLDKFRKWAGKGDRSPPSPPTGISGPIKPVRLNQGKSAYQPKATASKNSLVEGKTKAADANVLRELSAEYEKLYSKYNELAAQNDTSALQTLGRKLNEIKAKIEKARGR
ncbi:MAG: hypothetical protein Kow0029_10130 [Candidatus Rifleibacteriota bacterium]